MKLLHHMRCAAAALAIALSATAVAAEAVRPVGQTEAPAKKKNKSGNGQRANGERKAAKPGAKKSAGKGGKNGKNRAGKKKSAGQAAAEPVNSRYWALKVNVPYAAAVVQNLEFEAQVARKWTVGLPVMWSVSDLRQDCGLRTIALQPEARWWEGRRLGEGHFVGFHANLAWFNLKWDDTRYQARHTPLMGAGISYGYKLPLSAHWGAEFSLGVGYAYMKYDTFYNIDNGAKRGTGSRHYFGLDRVAVSLVYRF